MSTEQLPPKARRHGAPIREEVRTMTSDYPIPVVVGYASAHDLDWEEALSIDARLDKIRQQAPALARAHHDTYVHIPAAYRPGDWSGYEWDDLPPAGQTTLIERMRLALCRAAGIGEDTTS